MKLIVLAILTCGTLVHADPPVVKGGSTQGSPNVGITCSVSTAYDWCSNVPLYSDCRTKDGYLGQCFQDPMTQKTGADGNPYCVCGIGE